MALANLWAILNSRQLTNNQIRTHSYTCYIAPNDTSKSDQNEALKVDLFW